MIKNLKIISLSISFILIGIVAFCIIFYTVLLPKLVANPIVIQHLQNVIENVCGVEFLINKPVLTTSLKPELEFKVENIFLSKKGNVILNIQNLDTEINFSKILSKNITLKKLGADDIYIDLNKFNEITFKQQDNNQNTNSNFKINFLKSFLYIKKCAIIYGSPKGVIVKFLAGNINLTPSDDRKFLHFKILVDTDYQNERLRVLLADKNNVYIQNNKLYFDKFLFKINNSEILLDGTVDEKGNEYSFILKSDKFEIKNVEQFMNTNLAIPNGREIMSCFKDSKGDFNFYFNFDKNGMDGKIQVNTIKSKLVPIADIPLTLTKGSILIGNKDIKIEDFEGFYGKSKNQNIKMFGEIKDYINTVKSSLIITGTAYQELAKYISKISGINISFVNTSKIGIKVDFDATGKVLISGGGKVPKGSNILFDGASISSPKYDRAVGIKLKLINQDLNIKHINYYIADEINRYSKRPKPLVTIRGMINAYTGYVKELEFDVPNALPSEFFNILIGQRILRNGTFQGSLKFINGNIPKIDGKMILKGVIIAGQRFLIKNAEIFADKNLIHIISDGSIRRTKYKFDGSIVNNLLFPIVIDKINLNIDELDVEKVMKTFAPRNPNLPAKPRQNRQQGNIPKSDVPLKYFEVDDTSNTNNNEENIEAIAFQPNLLIIKECIFNVQKGVYKLINFGNLQANLTLTKDGLLEVKSNRFDFAEGVSSLKLNCDLLNEKYRIILGGKNIDTDIVSTSILNLNKEITGKTNAILDLNTDKNAKLNGKIKFSINDGTITKLGLVQYVLNMAAIFRNPIVMITPSTLFDLLNIPEGTFKKISGKMDIKDNIIEKMMIQSSSPQLSSFIVGQINLENMDASLRIYTKFSSQNKGFAGFLRNLSFASLSKKIPFNTKEDVSYYAAELSMLPELDTGEENAQVFLTKFDGDLQTSNFISSLKKIK
ncbi:hypothetical protein IJG14_02290 [bacterium]|nr:hypothetical protein [bacterium]